MKWKDYLNQLCKGKILFSLSLAFFLPIYSIVEAVFIPVGLGGYTTDMPAGQRGPSDQNNNPVTPKTTPNFAKPIQTNDWWTSLLWRFNTPNAWSENMFAHPFSFKAQAQGLEVGYPTNHFVTPFNTVSQGHKVQEYHYPHVPDLIVGMVGLNAPNTVVSDYSDWTVTAHWSDGSHTMETTMGTGIPFVYVTTQGGNALVTLSASPTIWNNQNEVIGVTVNGHHYGVFAPSGSQWTVSGNNLQSNLNGKNYYSIALLPDNQASTLEFFRKHAYAFVTNTSVSWVYQEPQSTLVATYSTQTTLKEPGPNQSNVNHPLMALYRHQWLNSSDSFLNFTYQSAHGLMKVVDASQFTVHLLYNGVLPFLPNFAQNGVDTYSSNQLYNYIDTIYKQTPSQRWQNTGSSTDTYAMGKNLCRIAHLIPIADQMQHGAARDLFIAEVKQHLQNWFSGQTGQVFYYNSTWDTLIGYPASFGSNTSLNDHHFHYGYFVMAASIIANYDTKWASESQWGGMVEMLIKDVANWDRNDTRFPFLRNFDAYAGHGWASGPSLFASDNNEESSSEELNFNSALILWGSLTGNQAIRDLGIYLYTMATTAIPQYWFDVDKQVFPSDFQPNTLGMVWSDGGAYSIWWNGTVEELHGINFLPINPGMLYLGHYPDYLKANETFMLNNNGTAHTDVWRDIHLSVIALYDSQEAINEFNANLNYSPEAGDSQPHTYHWIHNIDQLGIVDPTVTADIPTYAVFNKNGARNHVAFNPNTTAVDVNFSDGVKLTVPAHTIVTSSPSPSTHTFTDQEEDAGEVIFSFTPNWSTQYVKLNYTLNGGSAQTVDMTNQNGIWQYTIHDLKSGDKIYYHYIYEENGAATSGQFGQHVYLGNTPTPPPPPSSNTLDDTPNYTLSIQPGANGLQVVFVDKKQSTFVDLHYTVNGGAQANVPMQNNNNTWTYSINNLKEGDQLAFTLTYDVNGVGYDTKSYTYTYHVTAS